MRKDEGQLSIFDLVKEVKPCVYRFKRYIGQRVEFWREGIVGTITEIEPYYTTVATDYGEYIGTPTTICPVDDPGQQN